VRITIRSFMKEIRGQSPFGVILSGRTGGERFRRTIMANNEAHAVEKASRMASRMRVELVSVAPEHATLITWQTAGTAAAEEQARGSAPAG